MTILDDIIQEKIKEVEQQKTIIPESRLKKSIYFNRPVISLKNKLACTSKPAIIAEFKRKSPSKGYINEHANVQLITSGYAEAGAIGLSVLTDKKFFGGNTEDFLLARKNENIPILRKDFIIDEYQIFEAKAMGADIILLIAACLDKEKIKSFTQLAHSINIEVLLEIHDKSEINKIPETIDIVGVNNRNLKTFKTDISISRELASIISSNFIKISESGIDDVSVIQELFKCGYKGFLMGEAFMKTPDPAFACESLINSI